jgi:nucleoside-triphosphatase THEP1
MQTQSDFTDSPDFSPLAAAILDDGSGDSDTRLMTFAIKQQQAGLRVRGLYMRRCAGASGCKADMVLVDIATQDEYLVSQPLGQGSSACRADTQGFASASQVLRDALVHAPDLVICNRFGGLESEGGGFAAELLDIMASGMPLLTMVSPARLDAWLRFSGQATVLTATPANWQIWLDATLRQRRALLIQ